MQSLKVYSRHGCHLCEVLIEELLPLVRGRLAVEVCDIDTRPEWRKKYAIRIPLVEFENRPICQYSLDRTAISRLLDSLPAESGE